jgi:hypothetical protein
VIIKCWAEYPEEGFRKKILRRKERLRKAIPDQIIRVDFCNFKGTVSRD